MGLHRGGQCYFLGVWFCQALDTGDGVLVKGSCDSSRGVAVGSPVSIRRVVPRWDDCVSPVVTTNRNSQHATDPGSHHPSPRRRPSNVQITLQIATLLLFIRNKSPHVIKSLFCLICWLFMTFCFTASSYFFEKKSWQPKTRSCRRLLSSGMRHHNRYPPPPPSLNFLTTVPTYDLLINHFEDLSSIWFSLTFFSTDVRWPVSNAHWVIRPFSALYWQWRWNGPRDNDLIITGIRGSASKQHRPHHHN